jgi:hypothetical protein
MTIADDIGLSPQAFAADPVAYLEACGITDVRQLPTGEWAGVQRMFATYGLMLGLDWMGYRTRFCFDTMREAREALAIWNGEGWPPGYWIKQKPENFQNPNRPGRCLLGDKCHCTADRHNCVMWKYD